MAQKYFFSKYKIPIASIIICAAAFYFLSVGSNNPLTGRFISSEPDIIHHGRVLIYESGGVESQEKAYSLLNYGETYSDVLISSKDPKKPVKILVPEKGWIDLPQSNSGAELCLANDLAPNSTLAGYKISTSGDYNGTILQLIRIISYSSNTTSPCKEAGEYIIDTR